MNRGNKLIGEGLISQNQLCNTVLCFPLSGGKHIGFGRVILNFGFEGTFFVGAPIMAHTLFFTFVCLSVCPFVRLSVCHSVCATSTEGIEGSVIEKRFKLSKFVLLKCLFAQIFIFQFY